MSTIPGLFVAGEANFSDHGANRLGASALMQGLADGYFVLPYTIGNYLAGVKPGQIGTDHAGVREAVDDVNARVAKLLATKGNRTVTSFHRELGDLLWNNCGMTRERGGLDKAIRRIPELREEFWSNVNVPGSAESVNVALEHAGRVADFMELAELMCMDAVHREESCGGHFRAEHQTADGEALRHDDKFCYVAAWEWQGDSKWALHKEPLHFENVQLSTRSYK